jgi:hypothetical protein
MPGSRTLGRKYPTIIPRSGAPSQNLEDAPAHWHKPSALWRLAIGYEDHAVLPVEILDAHPKQFSFISHSGIAHQNNDVAKELSCTRAPCAASTCREQFVLRDIIKSQRSPVFLHQFDFRSAGYELPFLGFVKHSQVSRSPNSHWRGAPSE